MVRLNHWLFNFYKTLVLWVEAISLVFKNFALVFCLCFELILKKKDKRILRIFQLIISKQASTKKGGKTTTKINKNHTVASQIVHHYIPLDINLNTQNPFFVPIIQSHFFFCLSLFWVRHNSNEFTITAQFKNSLCIETNNYMFLEWVFFGEITKILISMRSQ